MKTRVMVVDEKTQDEEDIINILKEPAEAIRNGKLVVFPTETVYGLGANAFDENSVKNIFIAKKRPEDNPLIVHICDFSQLEDVAACVPSYAKKLIDKFWPGPITLIMEKSDKIPYETSGGLTTIGVRMPKEKMALRFLKEARVPVAAPSANISGRPSPTTFERCICDLDGRVDYIIAGEDSAIGLESTVIDCSVYPMCILRPGAITIDMIKEVDDSVYIDKALGEDVDKKIKPKSPGMKYRHYAPKADMIIIEGERENTIKKINCLLSSYEKEGKKVGVLSTDENKHEYKSGLIISIGSKEHLDKIASRLFEVLRTFDDKNIDVIISESFKEEGIGVAIMNRLKKAASFNIMKV